MDLNICMASDDNYAMHMGVCMVSVMENNQNNFDNINFHILDNNLSEDNVNKLDSIKLNYPNMNIHYYDIYKFFKENDVFNLLNSNLGDENEFYSILGVSTYARLFIGELLPPEIDKILYIDADTLVLNDLSELMEIDLNNYSVAGVIDIFANISKNTFKDVACGNTFINAGVLLINVDNWRKNNFSKLSVDLINNHSNKKHLHDQNILNILSENIYYLDPKFNLMSIYYYVNYKKFVEINKNFGVVDDFYDIKDVENALKNPTILHFISQLWYRPWINKDPKSRNPFSDKYFYYKNLSPWKNVPIEINKLCLSTKIYHKINRFLMINFSSKILTLFLGLKNR